MTIEARKLRLISELLKEDDTIILTQLEKLLIKQVPPSQSHKSFADFAGIWTDEEADAFKRSIEEGNGCGHADCLYKKRY